MPEATAVLDLSRLALSHGEGKRLELPVALAPFELGGQTYLADPEAPTVRLEASRPSGGFAFHLTFPVHLEGPCMRCLEPAAIEIEVDAREVDQQGSADEELSSPYVRDDELDIGRWAHDATILALPTQILCRPDCLGLCPVCGESLNDADPAHHDHGTTRDPRWAALDNLKLE
ncbi:MAG TPA: YceD family protein [Solirubrobacterales bacterium]|nr:YceD family protein [Solirubrobacterales bacterium]